MLRNPQPATRNPQPATRNPLDFLRLTGLVKPLAGSANLQISTAAAGGVKANLEISLPKEATPKLNGSKKRGGLWECIFKPLSLALSLALGTSAWVAINFC